MPRQSKKVLQDNIEKDLYKAFFQLLSDLRSQKEVKEFCEAFFSPTELSMIAKRLGIAFSLDQKKSYEEIEKTLKVSTATIASVSEKIDAKGFQKALELVRADAWANSWSKRILKSLRNQ
jgi:uncharacterized protein YerC